MPMAAPGKRNHRKRMAARHLPACLPPRRAATTAAATSLLLVLLAPQLSPRDAPRWLNLPRIAPASASGILTDAVASVAERMFPSGDLPDDDDYDDGIGLDIVEISAMRARDIKRRLARSHGYDPDELYRMIDKKDLINALSFEEHKARRRGADRRRWRRFRTAAICTCAAVTAVVFWPLVRHALEVGRINFDVYAGECAAPPPRFLWMRWREKRTTDFYLPEFFIHSQTGGSTRSVGAAIATRPRGTSGCSSCSS